MQFQSTLPRGERRNFPNSSTSGNLFQSTLPRGERHDIIQLMAEWLDISIHAPTRGATSFCSPLLLELVFQSTLPRGERLFSGFYPTKTTDFNPRSHEGSDVSTCRAFFPWYISIHAPTRGATGTHPRNTCHQNYFNPRSHEGSDQDHRSRQTGTDKFQSTLPRGERPFNWILRRFMSVFQSTLPRGERQYQGL